MRNRFYTILSNSILASALVAQPRFEMIKNYDGGGTDVFSDIYSVSDGSYIMCGYAWGDDQWDSDLILVHVDDNGDEIWRRTYESYRGIAKSVIEADNGDFVVGGGDRLEFHALRVSSDGDLIWRESYGNGRCNAVIELKNGVFVLAGYSGGLAQISCINGAGEEIWTRLYNQVRFGNFIALRETDNGVVVAGHGAPQIINRGYVWVVKVQSGNGELIWWQHFVDNGTVRVTGMASAGDGGFVISGESEDSTGTKLLKINSRGEMDWSHNLYTEFGYRGNAEAVVRMPDRGFVTSGRCTVNNEIRPAICRTNRNGVYRWSNVCPIDQIDPYTSAWNILYSVTINNDDEPVAAGRVMTVHDSVTNFDGLLIKFGSDVLGPRLIRRSPEDTVLVTLLNNEIEFIAVGHSPYFENLDYEWTLNGEFDGVIVNNDTVSIVEFGDLGDQLVECRVSDADDTITVHWRVTVTDLYIQSFTPDTLNLILHRGVSVDFSLDSVAAVGGNDNVQFLWTKTNLDNQEAPEDAGTEPRATIAFLQSGNYAVEGLAYREQSSDAVVWNVDVRGAIWSFAPEDITLEVLPDSLVRFEVVPSEPDSVAWSITWLVDGEVARFDETTLEWRFFGEADSCPPHLVQVIVADSVESDTVTWEVTARELGVGDEEAGRPGRPALLDVSPNPFNSMLAIRYDVGARHAMPLQLAIYDVSGREVVRLVDGGSSVNPPWLTGRNSADRRGSAEETSSATWNASSFPAGVYLVRLQTGQEVSTKKVVLIR